MKIILFLILSFFSIGNVHAKETVTLDACVDGDTFHVILKEEKRTIRMIAVDTPESVHPQKEDEYYGQESSEYTCNKLKNAKKIEIEYEPNGNKTDRYGRLTVWVFVDDKLFQQELIEIGYAKIAYLHNDYKYANILKESQELASAKNIGIWNEANNIDNNKTPSEVSNNYTTKEIIIIIILVIIIIFSGNKAIKRKATKKLKKYLK